MINEKTNFKDYLQGDEKIKYKCKTNVGSQTFNIIFFITVAFICVLCDCFVLGVTLTTDLIDKGAANGNPFLTALCAVVFIIRFIPLGMWFMKIVNDKRGCGEKICIVTNERFIVLSNGVLSSLQFIGIDKIKSTLLKKNSLSIIYGDEEKLTLKNLSNPQKLYDALNGGEENDL